MNEETYALITVNRGGEVHVEQGIKTLELAKEARCIALHGMTIEDKKKCDERKKRFRDEWFKENPGQCYIEGPIYHSRGDVKFAEIFHGNKVISE